jgi:hypothetical protein
MQGKTASKRKRDLSSEEKATSSSTPNYSRVTVSTDSSWGGTLAAKIGNTETSKK